MFLPSVEGDAASSLLCTYSLGHQSYFGREPARLLVPLTLGLEEFRTLLIVFVSDQRDER